MAPFGGRSEVRIGKSAFYRKRDEIAWWNRFLKSEESYKEKWETILEATLKGIKADNWPFLTFGKHFGMKLKVRNL